MATGTATQMHSIVTAAEQLGVSPWTMRTWVRLGRVPHVKVGRRVLIRVADLEQLLADNFKPATRAEGEGK